MKYFVLKFAISGKCGINKRKNAVIHFKNQSAEGAGGLGIIRSNKVGETE